MNLNLHQKQFRFFESQKKFCLYKAGVGGGKSYAGAGVSIKNIIQQPRAQGFIGANTYRQLQTATLNTFINMIEEERVPFSYNQQKGIIKVFDTEVLAMSLENYNAIRGIEIGWFWIDEVRDTRVEAFEVLMGRLRDKNANFLNGRLTSTPSGFDWLYEYFVGEKKTDDFELIEGTSMDNPFLPEGYVKTLEQTYDPQMYQQEVLGKFVKIAQGQIYYAFDRAKHKKRVCQVDRHRLLCGMDFNVNPMTAVVGQFVDGRLKVLKEYFLRNSNTHEMGEAIKADYGVAPLIVPDSTGRALKTSAAGLSDHQILMNKGFQVASVQNPYRGDRYNAVNKMLHDGKIEIDESCSMLMRDLEQVHYKKGTNLPDTLKDSTLTHISDALGYLVWHLAPIERPRFEARQLPR